MKYKDQFTPWVEGELVVSDGMKIEALAKGRFTKIVRACAMLELDIKDDLRCARIRVNAQNTFKGEEK